MGKLLYSYFRPDNQLLNYILDSPKTATARATTFIMMWLDFLQNEKKSNLMMSAAYWFASTDMYAIEFENWKCAKFKPRYPACTPVKFESKIFIYSFLR